MRVGLGLAIGAPFALAARMVAGVNPVNAPACYTASATLARQIVKFVQIGKPRAAIGAVYDSDFIAHKVNGRANLKSQCLKSMPGKSG